MNSEQTHLHYRFSDLKVKLCRGSREWVLLDDLTWTDPAGNKHVVPAGFHSDFASVPRVMRIFAMSDAISAAPAIHHDHIYRVSHIGRRWADDLFFHALRSNGAPAWAAWSYWLAVRLFGWRVYRR